MKKLIIPAILVSLGTGAAFATNATSGKNGKAPVSAYREVTIGPNQTVFVDAQQMCSDVEGDVCTWSGDGVTKLHELNITSCGNFLYKP